MTSVQEAFLVVGLSMGAGLFFGLVTGYLIGHMQARNYAAKVLEKYADDSTCCSIEPGSKRDALGFCEGFGHGTLYRLADQIYTGRSK